MRQKRVLLITIAGVEIIILCILSVMLSRMVQKEQPSLYFSNHIPEIANHVNVMANVLYSIFLLAVVDFFFCIGQKRYNKSMFGVAIAMISFALLIALLSLIYCWLDNTTSLFQYVTTVNELVLLLAWVGVIILTYLGLTIAYIAVKARYLKTTPANL